MLLVEDTPSYKAAADAFFRSLPDVTVSYAHDYTQAMLALQSGQPIDGALVDCFFPEETGSQKKKLGYQVILQLTGNDDAKVRALVKEVGNYVDVDDELFIYLRSIALVPPTRTKDDKVLDDDTMSAIRLVGERFPRPNQHAQQIVKNKLGLTYDERVWQDYVKKHPHQLAMLAALDNSEHNQPLCVPLAEELDSRRINFVFVTSEHHHGTLVEPIHSFSISKSPQWWMHDAVAPSHKELPEWWRRAYNTLLRRNEF